MPTAYESSQLILKLFELRRDASLREARAWFVGEFTPETLDELLAIAGGERNASFRMVIGEGASERVSGVALTAVTGGAGPNAEAERTRRCPASPSPLRLRLRHGGARNAAPGTRSEAPYWDMAASLVVHGGIDEQMFLDANPEIWATFAKIAPFLADMRNISSTPQFAQHLETILLRTEGGVERLRTVREQCLRRKRG